MTTLTKKELLALATSANIKGRHDMSKDQLIAALDFGADANDEDQATSEAIVEKLLDEPKTVQFDPLAHEGNYIPTKPFNQRVYGVIGKNQEAYDGLAPQAKAIYDFMSSTGFKGTGASIVNAAVAAGKLKTTQSADILFAFYARKLENAGIKLMIG